MSFFEKLFKKNKFTNPPIDLSVVQVDMHSHLIPGIDDGAQTMDDSMFLIEEFIKLGYKKVITTPHTMIDYYKNTPDIIRAGLDKVREELVKRNMNIEIEAASEYFLDQHFMEELEKKNILTFGDKYVLFELSFVSEGRLLPEALFELQMNGYKPIMAHPERYGYWHHNYDKFHEWFDKGIFLQLNINSLTGHYNQQTQKAAEYLIENNMYQFIGSDCHHMGHIELTQHARKHEGLHKLITGGKLLNNTL